MNASSDMKDTTRTVMVGVAGYLTQLTGLDSVIKFLIGVITLVYIFTKFAVFAIRHYDMLRHPIAYIRKQRMLKANKPPTSTT